MNTGQLTATGQSSNRIHGADGIRAFACLIVVAHHLSIQLNWRGNGWADVLWHDGSLGVSIFFVLSGVLLARPFWEATFQQRSRPSLKEYAWARMGRIAPAYFICLLTCFALFSELTMPSLKRLCISLFFLNWTSSTTFFPTPVNASLWSIGVEVCFYVMLPIWALGLYRCRNLLSGMAYVSGSLLSIVVLQHRFFAFLYSAQSAGPDAFQDPLHSLALEWLPAKNPLGLFAHFLLGAAAAGVLARWPRATTESLTCRRLRLNGFDLLSVVVIMALMLELRPDYLPAVAQIGVERVRVWFLFYHWPLFPGLIAALLLALHYSAWIGRQIDSLLLRWTAQLSYGIYLWHLVVIELLLRAWPQLRETTGGQGIFVAACVTLTYAMAILSYYFVEQPSMQWLKAYRAGQKRRATELESPLQPQVKHAV